MKINDLERKKISKKKTRAIETLYYRRIIAIKLNERERVFEGLPSSMIAMIKLCDYWRRHDEERTLKE